MYAAMKEIVTSLSHFILGFYLRYPVRGSTLFLIVIKTNESKVSFCIVGQKQNKVSLIRLRTPISLHSVCPSVSLSS